MCHRNRYYKVELFSPDRLHSWLLNSHELLVMLPFNKCSVVAEMCDRLATTDMDRKEGDAVPLSGGAGFPSNTMWSQQRSTFLPRGILIHPAVWPRHGPTIGRLCPFFGRAAGFPSNTMWPGSGPTSMPSFIFMHATVWPQYTKVTDRRTEQTGQKTDSIGRTILQTVAQKITRAQQLQRWVTVWPQ